MKSIYEISRKLSDDGESSFVDGFMDLVGRVQFNTYPCILSNYGPWGLLLCHQNRENVLKTVLRSVVYIQEFIYGAQ